MEVLQNATPRLYPVDKIRVGVQFKPMNSSAREPITAAEVFEHIRDIRDPEHPYTLEALGVVRREEISVDDAGSTISVQFTPTIPHCSMATLIGLSIKVKLLRSLPRRFKIRVTIAPGMHDSEADINKQLADKERVAAAMENPALARAVNQCLAP
ncbi:Cytosolic iron-sulfur assembly component 2B [Taenia crassiceps]|uniref:Cytosolic iron-sulfur assembly component 2B n=1 Tax=Taenia crassiceps TaxID=6207 RepID=A0ABR4Q326_9CEST